MTEKINLALHGRDHELNNKWSWGRDYGKDILTDLNMLAHSRSDALLQDALKRAYKEIVRLRKYVESQ